MVKKYLIPVLSLIIIVILTILRILSLFNFYSDSILALTALIILWYTYETAEIRKSEYTIATINKENQMRFKSPSVFCTIYTNPTDSLDTRIKLSNLSNYPVAVKLNCNIKINGEVTDFSPAYSGKNYWNLQFNEVKEGHFSWLHLFRSKGIISQQELDEIIKKTPTYKPGAAENLLNKLYNSSPSKLSMDLEIFCLNEFNLTTYYPPMHYDYDFRRRVWIPILTSEKPYWEYNSKPDWIN
jgi:hypothetical protein